MISYNIKYILLNALLFVIKTIHHIPRWLQFHAAGHPAVQPQLPERPQVVEQQLRERQQLAEQHLHCEFSATALSLLHRNNAYRSAHMYCLWLLEEPKSS
jgi:hypothetical protein